MVKGSDGEYRLREQPARLPLSYSLVAVKADQERNPPSTLSAVPVV